MGTLKKVSWYAGLSSYLESWGRRIAWAHGCKANLGDFVKNKIAKCCEV